MRLFGKASRIAGTALANSKGSDRSIRTISTVSGESIREEADSTALCTMIDFPAAFTAPLIRD
jgi:hypothetical protein